MNNTTLYVALFMVIIVVFLFFLTSPKETPPVSKHEIILVGKGEKHSAMNLSTKGIELLKHMEGFKEKPYIDNGGHASIGYGHKIKKGELFIQISQEKAEELLWEDIEPIEMFLMDNLGDIINQNQFDALLMLIYNIGPQAFLDSEVYMFIKKKHYEKATKPWAKWVNVTKKVRCYKQGKIIKKLIPVEGLIKRRNAEIQLFNM